MSKTFKLVLILLVVASVVSAVLAVFAFVGKEKEYMKRVLLEDKLAATLKDKKRLEKTIDSNKKAKETAEAKMKEIQAKVKKMSLGVEEEKKKHKLAAADLAQREKEVEKLKEELEKERKEKLTISKKLEGLQFDYDKAKLDISKLKREREGLKKRMASLKEKSVDLDTIVVNPPDETVSSRPVKPVREPLRGRILVVNRDYSFIVTDLGEDDGVRKGMVLEVKDGGALLGKAEIDKVYDTMSSATVLPGARINSMKKGNLIIESL